MERMTIRGRDRIADGGRDRRAAEDHKAASAKNARPTIDSGDEDRTGVANQ